MFRIFDELPEVPTAHGDAPILKRVLATSQDVPHLTQINIATFSEVWSTERDLHVHPTMWENYLVLEGTALFKIGGQIVDGIRIGAEERIVGPCDMVLVPPNTLHTLTVETLPYRHVIIGVATGPGEPVKA